MGRRMVWCSIMVLRGGGGEVEGKARGKGNGMEMGMRWGSDGLGVGRFMGSEWVKEEVIVWYCSEER